MLNHHIVWIEDDHDVLDPVITPLVKDGMAFTKLRSYNQAIEHIEELRTCSLIILDIVLPPGEGSLEPKYESNGHYIGTSLLRELREDHKISTPILIFSVVADAPEVAERVREFIDGEDINVRLISKPIRPSELKQEVLDLLT